MPFSRFDDSRTFYRLEGREDRPVVVLAHAIGCDQGMWADQVAALLPHFRVLRYDLRGHGASEAPTGDYSIDMLAGDIVGLVDELGIETFAFCGISLGGMVAQRVAASAPDRVTHLVLANTSAYMGDPELWQGRSRTVLEKGMAAIADTALRRFFSPAMLARGDPQVASVREVLLGTDPAGYAGCAAAIRDMDQRDALPAIRAPTLILVGDHDVSTPWSGHGEILAERIHGAQAVRLPAAHLSNLERPRSFTAAVLELLLPDTGKDTVAAGFETRRAVLGDEHVDRAVAGTTGFTRDFQEMITRYAWGHVWSRPGLDHGTRRLLALAMTAALGRWEEFRVHVRTGLARELEPCVLREVLLHVAVYAGVPAANTAFRIAAEEIAAEERNPTAADAMAG